MKIVEPCDSIISEIHILNVALLWPVSYMTGRSQNRSRNRYSTDQSLCCRCETVFTKSFFTSLSTELQNLRQGHRKVFLTGQAKLKYNNQCTKQTIQMKL